MRDNERTLTGRHLLRSRRAGLAVTGVVGALCLLVTACSGSPSSSTSTGRHGSAGGTNTLAKSGAVVSISPKNGSARLMTSSIGAAGPEIRCDAAIYTRQRRQRALPAAFKHSVMAGLDPAIHVLLAW